MSNFGVIYDGSNRYGSVYLTREENVAYNTAISSKSFVQAQAYHITEIKEEKRFNFSYLRSLVLIISTGFVGLSIIGLSFLFWPVAVQELRYRLVLSGQTTAEEKKFPGFPQGDQWMPPNTTFSIVVPKIDAKAPVITNVDPANETTYVEALKTGVAHAKGTCFPGMNCTMYLFAHSAGSSIVAARYNAVFYLLRKLETGDQILVYYYGKKILYEVTGKEIVGPEKTAYLTDLGKEERLILQTCDPPGTALNRLLVFAKPKLVEYLK